jgi:hypothetical protein
MESDLADAAVTAVNTATEIHTYEWPGLLGIGPTDEARAAAASLHAHLRTERPWEDVGQLAQHADVVRGEFRERRRAILARHEVELEQALDRIKRREGFDRLDPDQRHKVLQHLREGAAAGTDDKAIAPPLEALEGLLAARREAGERRAVQQLDAFRESSGARPVVEVPLGLSGREIETEADLDRLLADLRARILQELSAKHRVRLKNA